MRFSTATLLPSALVLVHLPRTIFAQATSALTLSIFQPINGFSDACTKAYNTPLTDCSNSDFSGQGCSAKCIGFLDSLTNLLTNNCVGTSAYPNTLIGLFFNGQGAHALCSNAAGSSSPSDGGNGYGQGGGQNGAPTIQSAGPEASASATSTSTSTITSTSTSISSSSTISPNPKVAATSSTTTVVPITVSPEPTTTSVAFVGTTVAPESSRDASSSTSHTKSSTSSSSTSTSTGNGNGGGTPLDIGSSACRDAAVSVWLFALVAGLASVSWLL